MPELLCLVSHPRSILLYLDTRRHRASSPPLPFVCCLPLSAPRAGGPSHVLCSRPWGGGFSAGGALASLAPRPKGFGLGIAELAPNTQRWRRLVVTRPALREDHGSRASASYAAGGAATAGRRPRRRPRRERAPSHGGGGAGSAPRPQPQQPPPLGTPPHGRPPSGGGALAADRRGAMGRALLRVGVTAALVAAQARPGDCAGEGKRVRREEGLCGPRRARREVQASTV